MPGRYPLAIGSLFATSLACGATDLPVLGPLGQDADVQMPGAASDGSGTPDAKADGTIFVTDCSSCPNPSAFCCTIVTIGGQTTAMCQTLGQCGVPVPPDQ